MQSQRGANEVHSEAVLSTLNALESSSSWITRYETSGELILPEDLSLNGVCKDLPNEAKEVYLYFLQRLLTYDLLGLRRSYRKG